MTREAKLDQLRSMGVVDMTLFIGCIVEDPAEQKAVVVRVLQMGLEVIYFGSNEISRIHKNCGYKILGHPLTIGRCLWWIEKNTHNLNKIHTLSLCDMRHDKDKPLSEQDNKEEIADLLIGLK